MADYSTSISWESVYKFSITDFYVILFGEKMEGSGLTGSKNYQNSVSPKFPHESNFELLLSFPNI
jgi:hypothetical protein